MLIVLSTDLILNVPKFNCVPNVTTTIVPKMTRTILVCQKLLDVPTAIWATTSGGFRIVSETLVR